MSTPKTQTPARTSQEIAMQPPDPAIPVGPPPILLPDLLPLERDVELRCASNGNNLSHARHECTVATRKRLEKLRIIAPAAAKQNDADRATAHGLLIKAAQEVPRLIDAADRLEVALMSRAVVLHDIDADVASLAAAKAQLTDVAALNLPTDQLVVLNTATQLLPKRIEERRGAAEQLAVEIKALIEEGQIDAAAHVRFLFEVSGTVQSERGPVFPLSRSLFHGGYFKLPE